MKHILNDLSEQEKNSIREQHTGGMKVMTESFSKLINSKLGDVKPMVSEQIKTLSNSQERLFAFLKGVVEMSSGGGMGWKASDGPGVKLTSNMLGSHLNKYNDLYGGGKVELGKPLSWDLYPLNPQQFPKAEGVKCSLVNAGKGLYIELEGGINNASKIEATGGSGYLTTPGSVEEALLSMKNIYQNYKTAMNPRIK